METMVPKLVAEDIPLLNSLLSDVFPGVAYIPAEMTRLRDEIAKVCREVYLTYSDVGSDEIGGQWVEKVRKFTWSFTSNTGNIADESGYILTNYNMEYDHNSIHKGVAIFVKDDLFIIRHCSEQNIEFVV